MAEKMAKKLIPEDKLNREGSIEPGTYLKGRKCEGIAPACGIRKRTVMDEIARIVKFETSDNAGMWKEVIRRLMNGIGERETIH